MSICAHACSLLRPMLTIFSSVTGLLLAGVGHVTDPPDSQRNFLICDNKTEKNEIESAFNRYTKERKDIGIVLINQHVSVCQDLVREIMVDDELDCGKDSRYRRQVPGCFPCCA